MADYALKDGLNDAAVKVIGSRMAAAATRTGVAFSKRTFTTRARRGLAELELKARVHHIADALRAALADDPTEALTALVEAGATWERSAADDYGFFAWPMIELAGKLGRPDPKRGLEALRRLTSTFSAEFAIRGYIADDPKGCLATLHTWTTDPDEHVRRLVSEGTRPRLPWGLRVAVLSDDPEPGLALLERLKDDPSEYVRRSVANHLNDVAKDRPERVVQICGAWMKGASEERQKLIRHALRSLVKQGDPGALAVLGYDAKAAVRISKLALSPDRVRMGEAVTFSFSISSRGKTPQPLVVDYALHHVKKAGHRTRKTFKLRTLTLAPKETAQFEKRHAIREITTRRYHAGRHAIEILVNGRSRGTVEFDLEL